MLEWETWKKDEKLFLMKNRQSDVVVAVSRYFNTQIFHTTKHNAKTMCSSFYPHLDSFCRRCQYDYRAQWCTLRLFFVVVSVWDYSLLLSLLSSEYTKCQRNYRFRAEKNQILKLFAADFYKNVECCVASCRCSDLTSELESKHAATHTRADIFGVQFILFFPGAPERDALMCSIASVIRIRNCHQLNYLFRSLLNGIISRPHARDQTNRPTLSIAKFYFLLRFIPVLCTNDYATPWMRNCKHTAIIRNFFFVVSYFRVPTNTETRNERGKKKLLFLFTTINQIATKEQWMRKKNIMQWMLLDRTTYTLIVECVVVEKCLFCV